MGSLICTSLISFLSAAIFFLWPSTFIDFIESQLLVNHLTEFYSLEFFQVRYKGKTNEAQKKKMVDNWAITLVVIIAQHEVIKKAREHLLLVLSELWGRKLEPKKKRKFLELLRGKGQLKKKKKDENRME